MLANKLLLTFALRYPGLIILTAILGFSSAIFSGVSTALVVPIFLGLLGQEFEWRGPNILQKVTSVFDVFSGDARLFAMLGVVVVIIILKNITSYISTLVSGHLSRALVNSIRLEGLSLLLEVDLDFYAKNKVGYITSYINQEVSRTAGAIRTAISLFTTSATILVLVGILIMLSWQITIITTLLLFVVAISNQYFIQRAKIFGKELAEKSRAYSSSLLEMLTGIRLVKIVGNEEKEYQRIAQLIQKREQAQYQSQANAAAIAPINEVGGIFVVLVIVLLGRSLFSEQLDSVPAVLLTYLYALFRILPLIGTLNGARNRFANASPSSEIVADFLRRDNKPFMVRNDLRFTKLKHGIQFEQVSFAYPGHPNSVLQAIDLQIPKGKTIALVGASGAGKSTIADLLPRFYDPTDGRILVDDKDLREYDLVSLRQAMGVVSQDTFLFNNSVRYNIAYGREEATEAEVIEAAKRANAYEFIVDLPQGFETEIGDRGVLLSGGQRQRLAIARALLRNPDILILDEATSALDTVSERLVQQAIDELCRDRTTLVIAHRLSTVQNAHQIVVLDRGRVREVGSHSELLQKNGYYARLYNMQFSDQPKTQANGKGSFASLQAVHSLQIRLSHQVRDRLNGMLGSLRLVSDGFVDTPEEQLELLKETYDCGLHLLNTIEVFEECTSEISDSHDSVKLSQS